MSTSTTHAPERTDPATSHTTSAVFASLVGLTALVTLVQGLLAGSFVRDDKERDARSAWIDAHAWGAHIGTVLAVATAGYALWKLRDHKPLVIGSVLLAFLFLGESFIGGLIRDNDKQSLTLVHVPLAMALTGLTVWLSLKAVQFRKADV
jgi:hypothetical protein